MGHSISGFVAPVGVLREYAARTREGWVAELAQGLGFLPLTPELADELGYGPRAYEELWRLNDRAARLGARMSRGGAVAYVETDYFGGTGEQAAIVWRDGKVWSGPEKARIGPVSDALRRLGVEKGDAHDEFDAAGLARHRHNDDWVDEAREAAPSIERNPEPIAGESWLAGPPSPGESTPFDRKAGHRIAGFVAEFDVLRAAAAGLRTARVARLVGELGFLPVTDELAAETGGGAAPPEELRRLTAGLARLGAEMSSRDSIVYVETDYADADGAQAAVVWHTGDVVQGPERSRDAIEDALFWVDVEQGDCYDAFEAAGLDRHRGNEGWIRDAAAGEGA